MFRLDHDRVATPDMIRATTIIGTCMKYQMRKEKKDNPA
jgi:hypothetical protein